MSGRIDYIARLIWTGGIHQVIEFEASSDSEAWVVANDGIDPLKGMWVEVKRKPDPQESLDI